MPGKKFASRVIFCSLPPPLISNGHSLIHNPCNLVLCVLYHGEVFLLIWQFKSDNKAGNRHSMSKFVCQVSIVNLFLHWKLTSAKLYIHVCVNVYVCACRRYTYAVSVHSNAVSIYKTDMQSLYTYMIIIIHSPSANVLVSDLYNGYPHVHPCIGIRVKHETVWNFEKLELMNS